ncbi:hypothetical protein AMES_2305 [Amycolatopsis mediterranei S699]|uniref:SAV-6107-like HEPN domain-containing protein n=3 Tax=Amycolatopsis mediterranei TaxID=33910 RepID=A0A0H3D0I6_AMYMU|nr:SAV_6107 family HEPN domain-containing protein [Amycolatopsis mediterranei]AGT82970.1 hypothetical protein B737_2306 [Amycolatopsis mediterranei RB]ADJ44128.1 conserved hypothetical protein [Amycolatopsis mediterranei U32]AEK40863.1 hypothetical protein RAM_11865 [Amycolatopsis mediterranei S699]AFO75841.1 hypothetical protein AMES_2305 [Amycolatopsis mediterranei S699]KDO06441.1 hypothetical protein DV26_32660 [Amycolatopsis mediterranei]
MSVKVVSPTDPGQPELPMSLRPQPAPAAPQRGRSRQCLSAPAEPRQRTSAASAVDSRQPQLPIALCPSASGEADADLRPSSVAAASEESRSAGAEVDSGLPGSLRPSSVAAASGESWSVGAGADSGLLRSSSSVAAASGESRPVGAAVDSGQSELPLPVLAIPEQARPAGSRRPEPPMVAESGQLELPASGPSRRSGAASSAAPPADTVVDPGRPEPVTPAESGPPVASAVDSGHSELPVPEAPTPTPAGADGPPELSLRPPGADPDQSQLPMSLRPPASPAAAGLLAQARRGLAEAAQETRPAERFIGAYLAALRGAAAVLAARGRPHRGRARPASTWVLLDSVAPELREWSAFFASNSATRAAAQAGITGKVTAESATGLVGAATPFLELVRRLVHGLPITGEAHVA